MSDLALLLPDVPPELEYAAQSGELVAFVGAGISRLIQCPSWDKFADKVLEQLVPDKIDYYTLSQINKIQDARKRLSIAKIIADKTSFEIDYASTLVGSTEPDDIYSFLNLFNCSFVTTNYEKYIQPRSKSSEPEHSWRFFGIDKLLRANLDGNGNVIHLHGCIDDPENLVVTTKDYLLALKVTYGAKNLRLSIPIESPDSVCIKRLHRARRMQSSGNRNYEYRNSLVAPQPSLVRGVSGLFSRHTLSVS